MSAEGARAGLRSDGLPAVTPSDAQLLERTARGDKSAFGEFVERHRGAVFRFARWCTADAADAEDVLQQTFVSAWRAAGDARAEHGARPWLLSIARRAAAKARQRHDERRSRESSIEELGEAAGFGDERFTPERIAQATEQRTCIEAALTRLAADEREILVLRDVEGLDGAATAELLGISLAAQKSRLHRARLRWAAELRTCLDQEAQHAR